MEYNQVPTWKSKFNKVRLEILTHKYHLTITLKN